MKEAKYGATVVSFVRKKYEDQINLAWLTKWFPLSRQALVAKLEMLNLRNSLKNLYDLFIVIPDLKTAIRIGVWTNPIKFD